MGLNNVGSNISVLGPLKYEKNTFQFSPAFQESI